MKEHLILIVDDEPKMRRVLEMMLAGMGHATLSAANGREALDVFADQPVDLVITDLRMPEMDGLELLAALRAQRSTVPVVVITAYGTIETAVEAMKHGARDYLLRPFDLDALELAVKRVFAQSEVLRQNEYLRHEVDRGWSNFVGTSDAMSRVYEQIRQVGPSKASVMLTGETGTGKELAARAVHNASPRRDALFVPINCAALPAEMLEAELFGHERGAFTGALRERIGKFEHADGGTVFLDEITEMPMPLQAKLLRVLQEGAIERLGANRVRKLDIRFISATNRDPLEAVKSGRLREDIYYRLNVFAIDLPPLRQRREDIPMLVDHFLRRHTQKPLPPALDRETLEHLKRHDWPGNVRELENMVERATIVSGGGPMNLAHFALDRVRPEAQAVAALAEEPPIGSLSQLVEAVESRMIDRALKQAGGSKAKAAAMLDISERTLWYKLKRNRLDAANE